MTCHRISSRRYRSTSISQRDPIQEYGQTGSNQKSTSVASARMLPTLLLR
jgi:hypothetical protein